MLYLRKWLFAMLYRILNSLELIKFIIEFNIWQACLRRKFYFCFVCLGFTSRNSKGLFLALHSGISPDYTRETLWDVWVWTRFDCVQGKYLNICTISPRFNDQNSKSTSWNWYICIYSIQLQKTELDAISDGYWSFY